MSEVESPQRFSGRDFPGFARSRLQADPPPVPDDDVLPPAGDHVLSPGMVEFMRAQPARAAAVLIPVVARPDELTVLLTTRTSHLPTHAGQIAFPGGKMDEADDSPLATALREAEEEVGLDRRHVTPLGYCDLYQTGSGFRIVPVVGLVSPAMTLTINPQEVKDVFEVPLRFLMEAANHQTHSRIWKGIERHYLAIPYGERYIWGITAGIIRNFHDRLLT
ncbi:coenzyme A pyrophosphatase [Agaricicola taiwanensis]|uniref:Coenzyme A pyrophosphatase n=1 Tax=Agaricicola taiwanensis TaxID=591372 RepID=A0A8J2VSA0_9RHOB|nr:CoA pyrophosphatase [Agaricicola taiwanensis]GGE39991.1 coenzyme A pyrophosphatase [Agaricicola taiwanensis]